MLEEKKRQSEDYYSEECRAAVLEKLKRLEQFQTQSDKPFYYVWLTPDGSQPVCTGFRPRRFLVLQEVLRRIKTEDANLSQLISELLMFIEEQEHPRPPLQDEIVARYLGRPLHLTSSQQRFECLCKALPIPIEKQSPSPRIPDPWHVWILKEDGYRLTEDDYMLNFWTGQAS
jgi:hypothetical protein